MHYLIKPIIVNLLSFQKARRDLTVGAVQLKSAEVRLEQKGMDMLRERKDIDMKIMEVCEQSQGVIMSQDWILLST